MSKLTLLEKLKIFFDVSKSSTWFMILIIIFLGLGIFFLQTNKKNVKRNKTIYIMISTFIIVAMVSMYSSSLSKIFDYMMNHFFIAIYFPDLAIYMAALVAMNIIVWISLFHFKTSEWIKRVNIIIYIIMNYLLVLILNIINTENLDIFTQDSIYGNKKALALIELSSTIFVTWIIFLILYKVILIYLRKDYKPKVKKVIVRRKKLPENYDPTPIPSYIKGKTKKAIKNIPLEKEYEEVFTLEDYRILSKLLKEQQKKEGLGIKKQSLEQLKIVDEKQKEIERENEKYTDLERMYRGIR